MSSQFVKNYQIFFVPLSLTQFVIWAKWNCKHNKKRNITSKLRQSLLNGKQIYLNHCCTKCLKYPDDFASFQGIRSVDLKYEKGEHKIDSLQLRDSLLTYSVQSELFWNPFVVAHVNVYIVLEILFWLCWYILF